MARKYHQLDQQVLLAGEAVEALDTLEMLDGLHHLLSYRFPIRDLDGLPYLVGAIGIDVTARQRAEEALAAERQRFFSLLENLPAFIYLQAQDYSFRFANRQFRERFGDPEGRTCYSLLSGRELPCPECPTFKVFQSGEPQDWEWQASDGRIYQLYDYPFADVDGTPLVLEMGIDITAKKQAEEEALHQTRLFEAFFDYAITPLVFLDPQFNFIRVNQAYARACTREVSEFAGRNYFDLYPSDAKLIFEEVVRSKNPYVAVARPFEFPDHPEWGITYWDWSLVPMLDEAGEVEFLVFSLNDVTEQVMAEEERRRLVEILENTTDFVGIADFYGNLLYLNRAGRALVGVGLEEDVRQLKVLELHPDRFGELILQEGAPTARREGSWQAEIALLHRDGREVSVSQVILAHKDATGRVQFFSTIARDISDLKQAQGNIIRQSAILNGINRIFREALTCETKEELGRTCLAVAEELTDSRFGFIDELNEWGTFDALTFSDPGGNLCSMPNIAEVKHLKDIKPVGLLARPIQEGKPLIANDPASHPDAVGIPSGHPPLTAYLGVPLISGERTIGLIGLGNKPGGYSRNDQGTVETLAPSIVEALMHHQARRELQRSENKLRHLADQLLTAQENERKRLAAELHDELGHALLTLKLALSSIAKELLPGQEKIEEEIQEQLAYINDVIGEVRRLYHDLSPGDVEDLGLTKALKTMIEDFAIHQPHINWEVDLPALEGLFSQPVQTIIYRLVQEGLTNIGKHANPEHVNISAVNEGSQVRFVICDDGAGFDMVEGLEAASGLGLVAMEERLNMLGGSFVVWSKKEEGTKLSFSIPTLPEDER
jgi:PAS domain S-box-containing protein